MLNQIKHMSLKTMAKLSVSMIGLMGYQQANAQKNPNDHSGLMIHSQLGGEHYNIPYWGAYSNHFNAKAQVTYKKDVRKKDGVWADAEAHWRMAVEPFDASNTYNTPTAAGFNFTAGLQTVSIGADVKLGLRAVKEFGPLETSLTLHGKIPAIRDAKSGLGVESTFAANLDVFKFKDEDSKKPASLYIGAFGTIGGQRADNIDPRTGQFNSYSFFEQNFLPYWQAGAAVGVKFGW